MIGRLRALAGLELRQLASGLRPVAAALLLVGIALLAGVVRAFAPVPAGEAQAVWPILWLVMLNFVFLQTVVLLIPLLFTSGLIRNEVDGGTLVYLVTRPIPRPALLLTKYVAVTGAGAALIVAGMVLFQVAFLLPGGDPIPAAGFPWTRRLLDFALAGVLAAVGYGAIFTLVGLLFRRGLIWGIAYGFVSEFVLTNVPAVVQKLTLMHYVRSIALADLEATLLTEGAEQAESGVTRLFNLLDMTPPGEAAATILVVAALCLLAACGVVARREFTAAEARDD